MTQAHGRGAIELQAAMHYIVPMCYAHGSMALIALIILHVVLFSHTEGPLCEKVMCVVPCAALCSWLLPLQLREPPGSSRSPPSFPFITGVAWSLHPVCLCCVRRIGCVCCS